MHTLIFRILLVQMFWHDAKNTLLAGLRDKPRLGLVTDMDGTISPLAPQPDLAEVTPRCRDMLQALASTISLVAVVSGRSARDVQERVGLPGLQYIGNHGLERWADGEVRVVAEAAAYRPKIDAALAALEDLREPGILVEDKGATLSLHYRQTADPEAARTRLLPTIEAIAAASGLVLSRGHMVFEMRPPIDQDKGTAFRSLAVEYGLEGAIFIGDDRTDAAALEAARRMRAEGSCYALGVGVVSTATPRAVLEAADLLASGVSGVEAFLAWLVEARMASST